MDTNELGDLSRRLREGDEDAAAEVFRRVAARLTALARSRLDPRMRQKMDPDDVLQSVFRSFFVRAVDGQFQLENWDSLWSLLARVTVRKCGRRAIAFQADRRDVRREVRPDLSDEDARNSWLGLAREPTPDEVASIADTIEHLMRPLNPRERQVLCLRLQGYSIAEISEEVGRSERTVLRILSAIRERIDDATE